MKKIILINSVVILILAIVAIISLAAKQYGVESSIIWYKTDNYTSENVKSLMMEADKDYKILVLSDTQMSALRPLNNKRVLDLVGNIIDEQKPDLVVTTGDNVQSIYQGKAVKQFAEKMESMNIPWAVTLGNHDSEYSVDRQWHGNLYESAKNSLFEMGPSNVDGVGNYQLNIKNPDGNIIKSLIMLDSHAKRKYETGKDYDYIHQNQLEWYKWVTEGLKIETGNTVPSLLFFHIPLIEFQEAIDAGTTNRLFGEQNEKVFSAPVSSGLFEIIKEQASTTHIFNGHDHINNLSVIYEGIQMTYGLKSGPSSYYKKHLQGGTLITIKKDSYEVEVEHIYYQP